MRKVLMALVLVAVAALLGSQGAAPKPDPVLKPNAAQTRVTVVYAIGEKSLVVRPMGNLRRL